ncbi:MAG: sigma-70 family RNA polymerase sigma factor, partial [Gemmataceae bacterium]
MARPGEGVRQVLRAVLANTNGSHESDRDLLRRFAHDRDEAAFELLVARHGPMVLAVGRRVLGDIHAAEDIHQATFVLLAKKAGNQGWRSSVAPWLYQTAYRLSLKARTAAARRARREGEVAKPVVHALADISGQDLLNALDAELLALPESLRAPLVLCYLEGATRDEAALQLGCPLGTLKRRLEQGRDRLHKALGGRGLGLSIGLLSTLAIDPVSARVPATLAQQTTQAALDFTTTGLTVLLRPGAHELIKGGIGMSTYAIKTVLGFFLIGSLLIVAAKSGGAPGEGDKPVQPTKAIVTEKTADPMPRTMRVVVLGPDGKPAAGASVSSSIWTEDKDFKRNPNLETREDGTVTITLPKTYTIVRLWASKDGYVGLVAGWEQAELTKGGGVPAEYTFHLEPAVTAGGQVVDMAGNPVAGAKLLVRLNKPDAPPSSDGRVKYNSHLAWGNDAPMTDANGRWKLTNVPNRPDLELDLFVTHPDHRSD